MDIGSIYSLAADNTAWLGAGGIASVGAIGAYRAIADRGKKAGNVWMTDKEIKRKKLFSNKGITLGYHNGRWIIDGDYFHTKVLGTTGCGKGSNIVVPTLANSWRSSTVVHDPKLDLWNSTASWRSIFSHVLLWDGTSVNSAHYNFFDDLRPGMGDVSGLQNIGNIVYPTTTSGNSKHWVDAARALWVAAALHILYHDNPDLKTPGGVYRFLQRGESALEEMMEEQRHPVSMMIANKMFTKEGGDSYRNSVYESATVPLALWDDPIIDEITSYSDLSVSDLQCSDVPVSLYLGVRESDKDRLHPLVTIMIERIRKNLMYAEKEDRFGAKKQHELLWCLDEFLDLKIDKLSESLRTQRGFKMRSLLAAQSVVEVEKTKDGPGTLNNCQLGVWFRPSSGPEAEKVADQVGKYKYIDVSTTKQGSGFIKKKSHTETEKEKHIISSSELMQWEKWQHAIITGYGKPIKIGLVDGNKILKDRLGPPPMIEGPGDIDRPRAIQSPWANISRSAVTDERLSVDASGDTEDLSDDNEYDDAIRRIVG